MGEQLWFLQLKDIPKVKVERTQSQPNIDYYIPPSRSELNFHPLDLNFRGRLHIWMNHMLKEGNFPLNEILSDTQTLLVSLYLNPQTTDNKWLNQEEVSAQVFGDPKIKNFRSNLLMSLIRVQRRYTLGPKAIEILKPPNILYRHLIANDIISIDQLQQCPPDSLRKICTSRPIFNELKVKMQDFFPDWNPKVVFVSELPADKASKF